MALTQLKTGAIADDAVTTDKLANAINTERTANTAKSTNATHTGEVTGSGALTITDDTVDEANLKISNAGSNGQFLQKQSGNTGGLTWADATNTTINNNADNRVITGSGTANTLEGEANLTYDGSNLQFNTTANGNAVKLVATGNYYNKLSFDSNASSAGGSLAFIDFSWDGDKVADILAVAGSDTTNKDDGHLTFRTSPSQGSIAERMRIDSDGRLFLNTTAVTNTHDYLTVKRPASGFGEVAFTVDANTSTNSAANALIYTKSKGTYWNGYAFQSSHGYIGALLGKRDSSGTTDQEIRLEIGGNGPNDSEEKTWTFQNDGDLSIDDGNLTLASGHGIDFSATANSGSSELLDDYEEGTWTMTAQSGADSIGQAAANQRYTKIGNVVTVVGEVNGLTNDTSSTLNVAGLPYNVAWGREGTGSAFSNNVTFPSGYSGPTVYCWADTDRIRFYVSKTGGGWHPLTGNEIGNGSFIFTATYLAS